MTIIQNGGVTRERNLTVQVTLSRALTDGETLHLYQDSSDKGAMARFDDLTYTLAVPYTGTADPGVLLRFTAQTKYNGVPTANSNLYEVTVYDPPRSEILYVDTAPVVTLTVGNPIYPSLSGSAVFNPIGLALSEPMRAGWTLSLTRTVTEFATGNATALSLTTTSADPATWTAADTLTGLGAYTGGVHITYTARLTGTGFGDITAVVAKTASVAPVVTPPVPVGSPSPAPSPTPVGSPAPSPSPTPVGSPAPAPTPSTGSYILMEDATPMLMQDGSPMLMDEAGNIVSPGPAPSPSPTPVGSPAPAPSPTPVGSPSPAPAPAPAVSTKLANEFENFTLTQTTAVKFGVGTAMYQKTLPAGTYECDYVFFGDPAPGNLAKACYLVGTDAPSPPQSPNQDGAVLSPADQEEADNQAVEASANALTEKFNSYTQQMNTAATT